MKKILSLLLSVILVIGLLPASALAVETFSVSDMGIAFIKEFEGYRDMPYEDNGKWYVGYGTSCDPADFPLPISEMEAEWLLRQALVGKEAAVNDLLANYGISVTQHQFDALVSMTYTLGTQWMNPTYRLCSYLINGVHNYSEVEVVNAIGTWCHQGSRVLPHLADRRLREAFLFLYGFYNSNAADMYTYIHFDPDGGEVENKTVFYPVGQAYGQLPEPKWTGRAFEGWYTDAGATLTGQEIAKGKLTVTARWNGETSGNIPSKPEIDLSTWVNPYKDVKDTDWYYPYVRELSAKGVVKGYPEDGTFRAENALTAGEALKLILLAAGHPTQTPANRHWASGYQSLAVQLGCCRMEEIAELDKPISRRLIAMIALKAMGLEERYGESPFEDAEMGSLLTLYEEGILNGNVVGGKRYYYPNESIKRSEVCAIVSRISNWERQEKNDPAKSGYIAYRDQYYPLLRNVAAAPYDKNLFVLDGSTMYYNGSGYNTAIGIDVSSYQGEVDWQKVAAAGIKFAFIRVGGRGYSEGAIYDDKYFQQNLAGAKAAGVKVGVYFFSQSITAAEAREEALYTLEKLGGIGLEYPVVYDWEVVSNAGARTNGLDTHTLTDCAIAFCETIRQAGYTPMVYYNTPVGYTRYDLSRLTNYDVWYAQYASSPTMYYNYRIWQYTDSGKVPGVEGKVDMNIAMIPY